jgi:hypothetical protein
MTQYTISMPNLIAQTTLNPIFCGQRTTTYKENSSGSTVSYVSTTESATETITFSVSPPGQSVLNVGSIVFTVNTYLTSYPSIKASLAITMTFKCPAAPLLLNKTPITFSTPIAYDLSL